MKLIDFQSMDFSLYEEVLKIYRNRPTRYFELLYTLWYLPRDSKVYFVVEEDHLKECILYHRLLGEPCLKIYGGISCIDNLIQVIEDLGVDRIKINVPENQEHAVKEALSGKYEISDENYFFYMASSDISNLGRSGYHVKRLGMDDVEAFIDLKKAAGEELDAGDAENLLSQRFYMGIYLDDKLVSIGAAYIRLPDVWAIGDVFTHPNYRNLGLGTVVTSELTKRAVLSGAVSVLMVDENNLPAIKVFTKTGYKIVDRELSLELEK